MKRRGSRKTTEEISGQVYATPGEAARVLRYGYVFWRDLFDAGEVDGYRESGPMAARQLVLSSCRAWLRANREHNFDRAEKAPNGDPLKIKLRKFRKEQRARELADAAG